MTPTETDSIDLRALRLDDALALLAHAGKGGEPQAGESALGYLQKVIDGLCELSLRDPLTGLANRRQFHAVIERSLDSVARAGETMLLLMLDIDHFKSINDTHGHAAGDQVLRAIGATLARCVRPMDTVARYGGEEFAVILPSCRPAFGIAVAERIRQTIAGLSIAVAPRLNVSVTVSIGGAYAPEWVRSTPELWIDRADQNLYRAKTTGRNRAVIETPAQVSVSAEERGLLFSQLALDAAMVNEAGVAAAARDAGGHLSDTPHP
jgi:diguanylate cyclase (GGDEF)-like protein